MESSLGDTKAKSNEVAAAKSFAASTDGSGRSPLFNHHHYTSAAAMVLHAQAKAQRAEALGLLDSGALFGT